MAEEVLWANLVPRSTSSTPDECGAGVTFRVVALEEQNGLQTLEMRAGDGPPLNIVVQLSKYYIRSLSWGAGNTGQTVSEHYEDTTEDQAEAVDVLREFFALQKVSEAPKFLSGPLRLEIEFAALSSPAIIRRGVLTSCLPPNENFKEYHCGVREWYTNTLGSNISIIHQNNHRILAIHRVLGTMDTADLSIHVPQNITPLASFDRMCNVWTSLGAEQKRYATNWSPRTSKASYSSQSSNEHNNFYGGYGYNYKPGPALVRRAGDEPGLKKFQEQETQTSEGKDLWGLEGVASPSLTEKSGLARVYENEYD